MSKQSEYIEEFQERLLVFMMQKSAEIAEAKKSLDKLFDEFSQDERVNKRKLALAKTNLEQAMLWLVDSFAPEPPTEPQE